MIQIRKGVFETNSSSSHSIVVMKEPYTTDETLPDWRLRNEGIVHFPSYDLSFGWGKDILSNPYGRLCYAIASYSDDDDKIDEICELCRKNVKGFNGFRFDHAEYGDGIDRGYVDHLSYGLLQQTLDECGVSLEEFIFNNRYIVIIDNDNSDTIIDTMKDVGLLDMSKIEKIVE